MNSATGPPLLNQKQRVDLMFALCGAVRRTGEHIRKMPRRNIFDTVVVAQHQFSTVDAEGSNVLRAELDALARSGGGMILEESDSLQVLGDMAKVSYPLYICDALEGSVNAKRGLASALRRPIHAGTSVMVLEGSSLSSIAASAFYDLASDVVFSSVRGERASFLPFVDGQLMHEELVTGHDSQQYVVVPGYSNSNVDARADIEKRLQQAGFSTTGGSRSSAQDLIDMIGNSVDAYVDLRALFSQGMERRDEVLHSWDVGGILPVLSGLGASIISVEEDNYKDWQERSFSERLALIVAWPDRIGTILDCLQSLPFISRGDESATTIPYCSSGSALGGDL